MVFLKTGALLFGSGMVLFAFLEKELVPLGWLSRSQLVDAIAVGQMTPGPVLSSATFIGWLLAGPGGAVAATVAIFLPAFVLIAVGGPRLPRLRTWLPARQVLNAVAAASLGVLLSVGVEIGRGVAWNVPSGLVAAAGLFFLTVLRVPAWCVFLFGIVAGALRSFA
jgi:chromate transporter